VLAAISATFDHFSQNALCILFVDEIDNIGSRSGGSDRHYDDYWSSLANRLFELPRSGRLEKHIVIPAPDTEALIGIIAHHLGSELDAVLKGPDALLATSLNNGC